MRRKLHFVLSVCCAIAAAAWLPASPAAAVDPPAAAQQEWSIRSVAAGSYVSTEITKVGDDEAMLRARSGSVGDWERYTLHNANDSDGSTFAIRSLANGRFVTAEFGTTGAHALILRARSDSVGSWETFRLENGGDSDPDTVAIRSAHDNSYVTAEINASGEDAGALRARSNSVGSWERFVFGALTDPPAPTTAGPPPASAATVSAMSWNVCAANNSGCSLYHAAAGPVADAVGAEATAAGFDPDVIFLQELCEIHAKPVELELEERTGRGWDVRFAPSYERLPGITPAINVQKSCQRDGGGNPRGSFGIALALPDENTWYHWYPLPSPPPTVNSPQEQRVAICGTVPSTLLHVCGAHFSAGSPSLPPADDFRPEQALALLDRVARTGHHTVFGGDLNLSPPDHATGHEPKQALVPVYAAYEECDQATHGGLRTGRVTYGTTLKLDYVFGPTAATYSCRVGTTGASDHKPIFATITIP